MSEVPRSLRNNISFFFPKIFKPKLRHYPKLCQYPNIKTGPVFGGQVNNGKFRDELLNGEIFYTLKEAKVLIEKWRLEYNTFRPHSSLNYRPPAPEAYLH